MFSYSEESRRREGSVPEGESLLMALVEKSLIPEYDGEGNVQGFVAVGRNGMWFRLLGRTERRMW